MIYSLLGIVELIERHLLDLEQCYVLVKKGKMTESFVKEVKRLLKERKKD
jgi:hypothetical protein